MSRSGRRLASSAVVVATFWLLITVLGSGRDTYASLLADPPQAVPQTAA